MDSRIPSSGGRGHAGRVPGARDRVADVGRVSARRLPRCALLRAVRVHAGGDHARAELRDHARHAPQQAALAAPRGVRDGGRLGLLVDGGRAPTVRHLRLPQVLGVSPLRDELGGLARLRRHAARRQRRRVPRAARLLPQDVLRDPRLAGLELE